MSDPVPRNNGEFNIDRKRAILQEALDAFRVSILENDTLYKVICTVLSKDKTDTDSVYSDFSLEPNLKNKQYNLRLVRSKEGNLASDSAAIIDIVPILVIKDYGSRLGGEGKFIDSFIQLAIGEDADKRVLTPEETTTLEAAFAILIDSLIKFSIHCKQNGVKLVFDRDGSLIY
jgi:hypothetical protein